MTRQKAVLQEHLKAAKTLPPSDVYGSVHTVKIFAFLIMNLYAIRVAGEALPWWTLVISFPLLGANIYKFTIYLHDCSHFSLFSRRSWNALFGAFIGLFVLTRFDTFRRAHWQHHKHFGTPSDPQGRDYIGLHYVEARLLFWHLVRPLFGYNLFKMNQVNAETEFSAQSKYQLFYRFLFPALLLQATLFWFLSSGGERWYLGFTYPAAAATFGLFFSQLRGFCEHVPPKGIGDVPHVRTHEPNLFESIFLFDLNFNFHVEHHMLPSVPSLHLKKLHRQLLSTPEYAGTCSPSYASTLFRAFKGSL